MSEWISQAGLPQERVVGPWRELPATIAVLREIADGKMPKGEAPLQYPIFLKACHITQGVQHGTTMVASQAAFKEKWDKYAPTHPPTCLLFAKQRGVVCVCVCVLSNWVHITRPWVKGRNCPHSRVHPIGPSDCRWRLSTARRAFEQRARSCAHDPRHSPLFSHTKRGYESESESHFMLRTTCKLLVRSECNKCCLH
jgi:hypothetical protein